MTRTRGRTPRTAGGGAGASAAPFSSLCPQPAVQLPANHRPEDITVAKIQSHASLPWGASPAHAAAVVKEWPAPPRLHRRPPGHAGDPPWSRATALP